MLLSAERKKGFCNTAANVSLSVHTCRYVDHFMYKGHLCIITEYCEEGDLYG